MNFFKQLSSLAVVAAMLFSSSSCVAVTGGETVFSGRDHVNPSGKIITKNIAVTSDFTKIYVPSIIDVVVKQGNTNSVTLEGSDNLIKYCDVNVSGNTLNVAMSKEAKNVNFRKFDVKVYVIAKNLDSISISGTGDVDFKGAFTTSNLGLSITGTGDITLPNLTATNLTVLIAGTGDVKAKGTCKKVKMTVTGTGDIEAALTGIDSLEASVAGTGDIELSGSAVNANYTVSGTGDIKAREMKAKSVNASATGTGDIDCYASESFNGSRSKTAGLKCYGEPAKYNLNK